MDVWSDTQRQDQERTHPRNNESDAGSQKHNGETIELKRHVSTRDAEHMLRNVLRSDIPERRKIQRQKAGRKDTCQEGCVEIRYTREKEDTMTESRKERHVPRRTC